MGENPAGRATGRIELPRTAPPPNHGRTTAAWVTVTAVLFGALVSTVGVVATAWVLFWIGVALMVTGLVVGLALKGLGLGQPQPSGPRRGGPASDSDLPEITKEHP